MSMAFQICCSHGLIIGRVFVSLCRSFQQATPVVNPVVVDYMAHGQSHTWGGW